MKPENVYGFGRALLEAGDLDPVYTVVYGSGFSLPKLERWLLAYWCFYHVGTACYVSGGPEAGYWDRMTEAAESSRFPRGRERRHFRADNAVNSVRFLSSVGMLKLFDPLRPYALCPNRIAEAGYVMGEVQKWTGFGPWIAFKAADMLDRCGYCPVSFDVASAFFYDSPKKAANTLWDIEGQPDLKEESQAGRCQWAVDRILAELKGYSAPPIFDRPLNCQEAETILCKWGASLTGHYHIGEDVKAVRDGIARFAHVPMTRRLLRAGKEAQLWDR